MRQTKESDWSSTWKKINKGGLGVCSDLRRCAASFFCRKFLTQGILGLSTKFSAKKALEMRFEEQRRSNPQAPTACNFLKCTAQVIGVDRLHRIQQFKTR